MATISALRHGGVAALHRLGRQSLRSGMLAACGKMVQMWPVSSSRSLSSALLLMLVGPPPAQHGSGRLPFDTWVITAKQRGALLVNAEAF